MKRLLLSILLGCLSVFLLVAVGCAARTVITSDPSGAHISVNEHYLGETPLRATIMDEPGAGSVYLIKAEKQGYKTTSKVFREEGLEDAAGCIPNAIYFQLEPDVPAAVPPAGTTPTPKPNPGK